MILIKNESNFTICYVNFISIFAATKI